MGNRESCARFPMAARCCGEKRESELDKEEIHERWRHNGENVNSYGEQDSFYKYQAGR